MIVSFFVLSPRGDTILSKMYRTRPEIGAHERSHTEAFFRKLKFWNEMTNSTTGGSGESNNNNSSGTNGDSGADGGGGEGSGSAAIEPQTKMDPPPVFLMPDGQSYFHVNRNGLIFACSTQRNVSPCTVIEVRSIVCCVCVYFWAGRDGWSFDGDGDGDGGMVQSVLMGDFCFRLN